MNIADKKAEIRKVNGRFLITSILTILVATVGIISHFVLSVKTIHPTVYFMLLIIGTGWLATALTIKKDNNL